MQLFICDRQPSREYLLLYMIALSVYCLLSLSGVKDKDNVNRGIAGGHLTGNRKGGSGGVWKGKSQGF